MTEFLAPGVYIEEVPTGVHPIEGVATSQTGFIGVSTDPRFLPIVTSFVEFLRAGPTGASDYLSSAVRGFFTNGGKRCSISLIAATDPIGMALDALAGEAVSILCCPDQHAFPNAASAMVEHCELRKDRFCILQSPQPTVPAATHQPPVLSSYAAYYHPWLVTPSLDGATTLTVPPGGHVAGVYANTDINRGVWTSPDGSHISGVSAPSESIATADAAVLVDRGVNVILSQPGRGIVVWSARTTSADRNWKYVNIRRLLIYLEASINRGLQWVVFEPDETLLWETVAGTIQNFLLQVWRSGGLAGQTLAEAGFVRCDRTTMTQDDIDNGRLIAVVGVAPLRPAEYVILRVTIQRAATIGTPPA